MNIIMRYSLVYMSCLLVCQSVMPFAFRWCDPNDTKLNFSYVETKDGRVYKNYVRSGQCWHDSKNIASDKTPIVVTFTNDYTGPSGLSITIRDSTEEIFIVPCKTAKNGIALFSNPPGSINNNTCASLITGQRNFYGGKSYCSKDGGKTAFDIIDTASCHSQCSKSVSDCQECFNKQYDFSTSTCWNR